MQLFTALLALQFLFYWQSARSERGRGEWGEEVTPDRSDQGLYTMRVDSDPLTPSPSPPNPTSGNSSSSCARHAPFNPLRRFLITGSVALTESATDIYAPALSALATFFCCSPALVSLTMSYNLLGLALSSLVYGALSDHFGRRPMLLGSLFIFTIGSFGATFASSMNALISWRFIQGIGGGGAPVCGYSIVCDLFHGKERAQELSKMGMWVAFAPAVAPVIGAALLQYASWRMIFLLLSFLAIAQLLALVFFLKETRNTDLLRGACPKELALNQARSFSQKARQIVQAHGIYLELLRSRKLWPLLIALASVIALLWAEITHLPLVFIDAMGISPGYYSLLLSINVATYIACARLNQYLVFHVTLWRLILFGLAAGTIAALAITTGLLLQVTSPIVLLLLKLPGAAAFSFLIPNLSTKIFALRREAAGALSALNSFAHMALGALFVYVMGYFYDGTLWPLLFMQWATLFTLSLALWIAWRQSR